MSTLQWSLAILAAVVLVIVVGLNVWQARRGRRRLDQATATIAARSDARGANRIEPTITPASAAASAVEPAGIGSAGTAGASPGPAGAPGGSAGYSGGAARTTVSPAAVSAAAATATAAATAAVHDDDAEPSAVAAGAPSGTMTQPEPAAAASVDAGRQPVLNPAIDCIVEIELPAPQPAERLLPATHGLRRVGSKPVYFEGHDIATGEWQALEGGRAYGALRCGVLLANRHGPLNAMEFSELAAGLQPIAEQLDSLVHLPDMSAVLARAREVDAQCAELDAQVGLNIESPEPPTFADLQECAESNGLTERGNNLYAKLGPEGEVLFSLALGDVANRLTLLLDVPRAPVEHDPWRQMVDCAVTCAARLGGRIVDDSGRPLDLAALERIEEQLAERWAALEAAGFAAGSQAALRLFN